MTTSTSSPAAAPVAPQGPPGGQRPKPQRGWFAQLLLRLHFYAGVLVGPFILIAAVSGGLYALTPLIEKAVYAHELRVPIADSQLSLAEQIRAAQQYIGDDASPSAVRPAPEPGATTRVLFADPSLGGSESRAVFIDPATAEIRGDLTVYGTSGALPLRTWVDNLHRNLNLGEPGRFYSELAASWLGIIALAGLGLWIVRIKKSRTKKDFVRPARGYRGYRKTLSWHTSLGIWVLVGALFLSATGITWSQYAGGNVGVARAALGGGTPALTTNLDGAAASGDEHAHHHGPVAAPTGEANPDTFDAMLAIAQRINVNTGLVEIAPPAEPGQAWVVKEIQAAFPTEVDQVAINGSTMEVVDRLDFADYPPLAKLSRWGIDLHMGAMFGLANQLVLLLIAAGIATLVVLGYLMWWRRRPTRTSPFEFASPPRRGVVRGAPWWGIGTVAVAAIGIGVLLPFVGWTLLGFVVIDTVIGLVRQGRAAR
ncbi:PepSY-associated TM helix domain-containing protein [Leucobacter aridicollis]|uniref:PepSY-associated TM helix domain-containing protein n=1 Tax=Leucobacter aridicollis TaxID=283878 RepID=UPI002167FDA7|nr:PepSY-associated TM helix domain-containing protein [Leucobacter aridicollis]MCS3426504.1 putative iron-regulated membrane protein [Leucobacter aridicollis]